MPAISQGQTAQHEGWITGVDACDMRVEERAVATGEKDRGGLVEFSEDFGAVRVTDARRAFSLLFCGLAEVIFIEQ